MGFLDDLKQAAENAQNAVQRQVDNLQRPSAPPEPPPLDGAPLSTDPQPPPVAGAPPGIPTPTPPVAAAPPSEADAPPAQGAPGPQSVDPFSPPPSAG
jgi:hypothetical protein